MYLLHHYILLLLFYNNFLVKEVSVLILQMVIKSIYLFFKHIISFSKSIFYTFHILSFNFIFFFKITIFLFISSLQITLIFYSNLSFIMLFSLLHLNTLILINISIFLFFSYELKMPALYLFIWMELINSIFIYFTKTMFVTDLLSFQLKQIHLM